MSRWTTLLGTICGLSTSAVWGQAPAGTPASVPARWSLPPGVLRVIPSEPEAKEALTGPFPLADLPAPAFTPQTIPATETLAQMASRVTLHQQIWNLEFAFKPMRMVRVDLPAAGGRTERKLIWYMVYRVRYLGSDVSLSPEQANFSEATFQAANKTKFPGVETTGTSPRVRLYPRFVLEENYELKKAYPDRVIPAAKAIIFAREFSQNRTENPDGTLYDAVEISTIDIPQSDTNDAKGIWGVVTWENIDPRVDYFSVYIQGLTNAQRLDVSQGRKGSVTLKTLKLNFWRPGDSVEETEEEVRFGIPVHPDPEQRAEMLSRYGQTTHLDFLWLYR